jgi:HSP20 family protein
MARELIRLMNALFLPGAEALQQAPWYPNTDVYRTPTGWIVKFELAGVRPEDIDLTVLGRRMILQGVRRDCVSLEESQSVVHYSMEISYSRFERTLDLPCDLKKAAISTDYRAGMLLVRIQPAPDDPTADSPDTERLEGGRP